MKKLVFLLLSICVISFWSCKSKSQQAETASVNDVEERWKSFPLPPVDVQQPYPDEAGSKLYFTIVENPEAFIREEINKVNAKLPAFQRISKVVFRDTDFARSPAMKILRNQQR